MAVGKTVHNANDSAAILSDAFLNNSDVASFPRAASTNPADDGLYVYDRNASGTTTHLTSGPLGATRYTNPQINDNGLIGMRVKFNTPQALMSYNIASNSFVNYVTETSGDPQSRYSFLFAPAFNNNNRIAAEANINGQSSTYKELRVWIFNGSNPGRIGDSSIGLDLLAFDNSISMNNPGQVAFTTRTSTSATTRRTSWFPMAQRRLSFPTVSGCGFHRHRQLRTIN